jgi:hypothetical protein
MATVQVEAAVAGRKRVGTPEHQLQVSLPSGPTSLRDLIEAIVRAEVSAFIDRAEGEKLVRVLTEQALEEGLAAGSVRSGGREVAAEVDPDEAVRAAIEAQRDGLFQTVVDEEPIDDLETVIELRDGTRVMFLRLVALAGG